MNFNYDEPRYIYFIQRDDTKAIKIGMSQNPLDRLEKFQQRHYGIKFIWLGVLPEKLLRDSIIHRQFEHLRLSGEWFRPAPELLSYINKETSFDYPEFNEKRYLRLASKPACRPRCLYCGRVTVKPPIMGVDSITGKTGAFHKACFRYQNNYTERPDTFSWEKDWALEIDW